jgi:uncharacterized protein (TIGR02646 family)
MIKLTKHTKPHILLENAQAWTQAIVDKLANGQPLTETERTRYRHSQIKQALVQETHGKCAYCESKLLHIHHGDVEHITPKSLKPELTVEWENLTLACEICNQNKSNLDPAAEHIIDPYHADPQDHLIFIGALVCSRGTAAGTNTRAILDLNRGELSERRRERLEAVMMIVEQIMRDDLPIQTRRALYHNLRTRDASADAPYSAMITEVISIINLRLPQEITI